VLKEPLDCVVLGKDGISYVETCLRQGTGLCERVLRLPLVNGEAFAPLPKYTSIERAKSFEIGGLLSRRDSTLWLAKHIKSLYQNDSPGTWIVQDIWAKPSDPAVLRSYLNIFLQAENVYYFIGKSDTSFNHVQSIFRSTSSFLFVAFFSRTSIDLSEIGADRRVSESLICKIAKTVEEIFVGAYDQEGLIVWRSREYGQIGEHTQSL
jgi:hypothetical protein